MRVIFRTARSGIDSVLSGLERIILNTVNLDSSTQGPMFIIGSPRSGTTLLYQLLADRYTFGYFNNFTALFPQAPIVANLMAKLLFLTPGFSGDYKSRHGRTNGWRGLHEAGQFWYRWFPKGEHIYVPSGVTSQSSLRELQREVAGIVRVTNMPLLLKNTYNSMRIAPIMEAFPKAVFLVCNRDPVDTAQSILKGRMDRFGNKESWWSLPPKEIDVIKQHPYWEQVVEQVYYTYRQINEDCNRFAPERSYDVHYEQLCKDTRGVLLGIEKFLAQRGFSVAIRGDVPSQFAISSGQQVSDQDYRLICAKVQELWN